MDDARTEQRGMSARVRVTRYAGSAAGGAGGAGDVVVVEEPLQVHLEQHGVQRLLGSTMRTPGTTSSSPPASPSVRGS